jgi:acyl-CoA synthetase (AMP-forming)/AMP-acid ligase II
MNSFPDDVTSLTDVLTHWASEQPNARAYVFLKDRGGEEASLTFGELKERATAFAARINQRAQPGECAILLFPPGLDFIVAFFGCLQAGVIAVPLMVPRRTSARDSSTAILADCAPRLLVTNRSLAESRPDVAERLHETPFELLLIDAADQTNAPPLNTGPFVHRRKDIAFLQYTSGSTSSPKGVMVSHGNLLENLEMIRHALGMTRRSTGVCWIPLYHDMGLILNVLASLYAGANCVLMAPGGFMQRPLSWLRAIHLYRAEVAGAPNFAFDLCVTRFREDQAEGLDLSSWRIAYNAAEPVRADTLERFAEKFAPYGLDRTALCAFYGLAEATVLVSGGRTVQGPVTRTLSRASLQHHQISEPANDADRYTLVGCGHAVSGEKLAIVDPQTQRELAANYIGEIWVSGPNVAPGYWKNATATRDTFQAVIEGRTGVWLRTGDLGFLDEDGELFVTGRIKDLIIIRGVNHYPQDIENTAQNSHPALRRDCGAAFAAADENDNEMLVIVHEVERAQRHHLDVDEILGAIREAVVNEHEIAVGKIVLVRPGALPKTTSGKVQRNLTRVLWQKKDLDIQSDDAAQRHAAGR